MKTGAFRKRRHVQLGNGGSAEVYDNTCTNGAYAGLVTTAASGGAFPPAIGDHGAIPSDVFPGDASCTAGCSSAYNITQFEIAWCQADAPITGSVIELHFWNPPQFACTPNPIGGMRPPAVTTALSATLVGLPRNNTAATLACYVLNVSLGTPGFMLEGSDAFASGDLTSPNFAWSFSMPTSTGSSGPLLAGNPAPSSPCLPCAGTIWEVGGQTTLAGTGAGQSSVFFLEYYGGILPGPGPCFTFGTVPPTGLHLELFASKPCLLEKDEFGVFCDGSDSSLTSCPCAPGGSTTGCANPVPPMQGGGLGDGVQLRPLLQDSVPANRATFTSSGFPSASTPGGVIFRNTGLDPQAPVVFGDGLRCVDALSSPGTLVRIGASAASGGSMTNVVGHGAMAGSGTFYYQLWYRSTPASYCDPTAAFNLSNGISLTW